MPKDRGDYASIYHALIDSDEYRALSRNGALVWWAIKCAPELGLTGLFPCFREPLSIRSKVPMEELAPAMTELENAEWIQTEGYFVWVRNHLRFNPSFAPNNPKHVTWLLDTVSGLPKIALTERFVKYYQRLKFIPIRYRLRNSIGKRVPIRPIPSNPSESDTKPEDDRTADSVFVVFAHWRQVMGKDEHTLLTPKRRALVKARLKEGYSVADLLRAIDGNKASKFHQGENRDKRVYNDFELIFRSAEKVEQFRDMTKAEPAQVVSIASGIGEQRMKDDLALKARKAASN